MLAGLAIMLLLAAPAVALRLGTSDAGNDPAGKTTRKAYDLLGQGFGRGFNGPLLVVASLPSAGDGAAVKEIASTLRATKDVASVSAPRASDDGRTVVLTAFPASSPQSQASTDLVSRLRDTTLPPLERSTGSDCLSPARARSRRTSPTCSPARCRCSSGSSCCSRRCCCSPCSAPW